MGESLKIFQINAFDLPECVRLGFNSDVDTSGALINMYGKCGYRNHVMVGNALVHMHATSGSLEDAWKAFSGMIFRDIVT
ncbi:hypothetical protein Bca4012_032440 [Brassica carinata]